MYGGIAYSEQYSDIQRFALSDTELHKNQSPELITSERTEVAIPG